MKKALLTLAAALSMGFAANADVVSVTTEDLKYDNAVEVSKIEMNSDITISLSKGSNSNAPKYYASGSAIRFYGGNTMTFTAASGFEITDITITQNAGGNGWNAGSSVKADGKTGTFAGTTGSQKTTAESIWSGKASSVEVTNGGTKGNVRLGTIKVTYASTVAAAVETPVITLVEGDYGFNAEITCATEGAEIFYTTDGTEPTAESTKYNAPFEVWEKCTIQAIAIKGDDKSRVATLEANPPMMLDGFSMLSDMMSMIEEGSVETIDIIVKGTMKAVYQNGSYLWVECGGSYALVYGNLGNTYTNGDTFDRLQGTFKVYNGLPEIQNATLSEATPGTPVRPSAISVTGLDNMLSHYVVVYNVEISGTTPAFTLTDAEGETCVMYNSLKLADVPTGKGYAVTGFVGRNTKDGVTTMQIIPVSFEEMETVETPVFSPVTGSTFDIDTDEVEITCATEDAEIYYTLDGTEPTMDEGEYYSAPFKLALGEEATIKAIAYKEGWIPSAIAEVTYKLTSGVEDVVIGSNEAVEYFNLQGVRVAEPAAGLYIRRQGNKVEKVTVK